VGKNIKIKQDSGRGRKKIEKKGETIREKTKENLWNILLCFQ
jgi:hypothetical protein